MEAWTLSAQQNYIASAHPTKPHGKRFPDLLTSPLEAQGASPERRKAQEFATRVEPQETRHLAPFEGQVGRTG